MSEIVLVFRGDVPMERLGLTVDDQVDAGPLVHEESEPGKDDTAARLEDVGLEELCDRGLTGFSLNGKRCLDGIDLAVDPLIVLRNVEHRAQDLFCFVDTSTLG